jgi:tetratricopeptide (TPR) repeat protein
MRTYRIPALVLFILLGATPLAGHAGDELFDAKAATRHIEQGLAHLKAKNFDAAVHEFEESAAIYPDAEAYYFLGYTYYLKSRNGDGDSRRLSLEYFEKAYEIDPNFAPTRYKPAQPAPETPRQPAEPGGTTEPAPQEPEPPQSQPEPQQPHPPADQPKQESTGLLNVPAVETRPERIK